MWTKITTTAPIRDDSVYVSWQTRKALGYIPRAEGETVDGLAERVLIEWMQKNYPEVLKHLSEQGVADKAFRETVKRKEPGPT